MTEKKFCNFIKIIVFIFIFLIVSYVCNFGLILSPLQSDWGTFGDFIGGILNPIIAFLNVFVLYYLTKEISQIDIRHRERDREAKNQDRLFDIKFSAYQEITHFTSRLVECIENMQSLSPEDFKKLSLQFINLIGIYSRFFDSFQDFDPHPIIKGIKLIGIEKDKEKAKKIRIEISRLIDELGNELNFPTSKNIILDEES